MCEQQNDTGWPATAAQYLSEPMTTREQFSYWQSKIQPKEKNPFYQVYAEKQRKRQEAMEKVYG